MFDADVNLRNLRQNDKFKAFLAEQARINGRYTNLFAKPTLMGQEPVAGHL